MSDAGAIEKLRREHILDSFDCGKEDLNRFLKRQAWNNQQRTARKPTCWPRIMLFLAITVWRPVQ